MSEHLAEIPFGVEICWAVLEQAIADLASPKNEYRACAKRWLKHGSAIIELQEVQTLLGISDDTIRIITEEARTKDRLTKKVVNRIIETLWYSHSVPERIQQERLYRQAVFNKEERR